MAVAFWIATWESVYTT